MVLLKWWLRWEGFEGEELEATIDNDVWNGMLVSNLIFPILRYLCVGWLVSFRDPYHGQSAVPQNVVASLLHGTGLLEVVVNSCCRNMREHGPDRFNLIEASFRQNVKTSEYKLAWCPRSWYGLPIPILPIRSFSIPVSRELCRQPNTFDSDDIIWYDRISLWEWAKRSKGCVPSLGWQVVLGVVMGSCLYPVLDEVHGLLQMLIKVNCNKTGQPRVSAMLFCPWCCELAKECLPSVQVVEWVFVCSITREPSEDHEDDHDDDGEADKVGHECVFVVCDAWLLWSCRCWCWCERVSVKKKESDGRWWSSFPYSLSCTEQKEGGRVSPSKVTVFRSKIQFAFRQLIKRWRSSTRQTRFEHGYLLSLGQATYHTNTIIKGLVENCQTGYF